ncbi:MAG: aldehyde-activating protein [Alphaproteobacteria bacterium]
MNEPSHRHSGSCHCGAIAMDLAFTQPAEEMQVRSCQCGFCIRQGSLTVSEAAGRAVITVAADQLTTYSFGSGTASFLICARCGVYAGVIMADGEKWLSIANARGLGIEAFRNRTGVPLTHDGEATDDRLARRKSRWTPTEIRYRL